MRECHCALSVDGIMTNETPMQRADRVLGRLVLRTWAIVAFIAAVVSTAFGAAVLGSGQIPGLLILVVGALFFWLGVRAWRDRAGFGAMLNRDFERTPGTGAKSDAHADDGSGSTGGTPTRGRPDAR